MGFNSAFKGLNTNINIRGNINLSVFLYVFETWSLTLREKLRPKTFENRVLRKIFGPKRDEVTGEWRQLKRSLVICTSHQMLFS